MILSIDEDDGYASWNADILLCRAFTYSPSPLEHITNMDPDVGHLLLPLPSAKSSDLSTPAAFGLPVHTEAYVSEEIAGSMHVRSRCERASVGRVLPLSFLRSPSGKLSWHCWPSSICCSHHVEACRQKRFSASLNTLTPVETGVGKENTRWRRRGRLERVWKVRERDDYRPPFLSPFPFISFFSHRKAEGNEGGPQEDL